MERDQVIVRTSLVGIGVNVLLAATKAGMGLLANSIAMVLDAVNNLSDALSSIITIVGAKLSAKLPDRKHPMGYGRIEYISALMVAALVLYAGITSAVESVKKIISPEPAEYSVLTLVLLVVAVAAKILLGRYVKKKGEEVHSGALEASGADALSDAILSSSVLACAVVFLLTGWSLEAYVGLVISGFIIKSGVEMMMETLDDILGQRPDAEFTKKIRELIVQEDKVRGAYDLILNNYGPNKNLGSVHIEVPDTMTVEELDPLIRRIQARVLRESGVIMTGIGVYAYNTKDDEAAHIRNRVMETVLNHDWALQVHGFYVDVEKKTMRFDVVMSFEMDPKEGLRQIHEEVRALYPDYRAVVSPDVDVAD